MKNKQVKQMIIDVVVGGRKVFWFGEFSEKFLAYSLDDVIEQHREWLGNEEVEDILAANECGEIALDVKDWWGIKLWNEETERLEPLISGVYKSQESSIQIAAGYA